MVGVLGRWWQYILEFFSCNAVELVCQVEENSCACGKAIVLLGVVNIFLDGELHCFHYEVRSVRYADSIIVGEEVVCKYLSQCLCNVAGYEASDRGRDTKGS